MAKAMTSNEKSVVIPAENAEAVKANLKQVADELTRVRDRAREEADSLDRIRGMIDLKYLNDLLAAVNTLESRVQKVEKTAPARPAKNMELLLEQKRLTKLWDAFKSQEDELKVLVRERDEILARLQSLERQLKDLGSPASIRTKLLNLEAENRRFESEASSLSNRVEKYATLFSQEQERLAKLYKVYEDTESRLGRYEGEARAWRVWWEKFGATTNLPARNAAKRIKKAK